MPFVDYGKIAFRLGVRIRLNVKDSLDDPDYASIGETLGEETIEDYEDSLEFVDEKYAKRLNL